jgi:hypothetical protein
MVIDGAAEMKIFAEQAFDRVAILVDIGLLCGLCNL